MAQAADKRKRRRILLVWGTLGLFAFIVTGISFADMTQPAALHFIGTNQLKEQHPELTGEGVRVAAVCRSLTYAEGEPQSDYQLNLDHSCFQAADVRFWDVLDTPAAVSEHANAIGALLAGRDPNGYHEEFGPFEYEGCVPDAQLDVYEFWSFASHFMFLAEDFKPDILTLSIGSALDEWWTRGIEYTAEARDILVVASAGNGSEVFDPLLYPAGGDNVVAVGVADSINNASLARSTAQFGLARPEHSSTGPSHNERCKPDIVAPGNCLIPSASEIKDYEIGGDWSSFSTPLVAGTAGLLVQAAEEAELLEEIRPLGMVSSLSKAILVNSAQKLPYWHKGRVSPEDDHEVPYDYLQGAGMIDAEAAYDTWMAVTDSSRMRRLGWDVGRLDADRNNTFVYRISTEDQVGDHVAATLIWKRHYAGQFPFDPLAVQADLRLEIWAVDPQSPDRDYLLDYCDSPVDFVEHLYTKLDPAYSEYEVVVTFNPDVSQPPSELFAVAWELRGEDSKDHIGWYDLDNNGSVDVKDVQLLVQNMQTSESSVFFAPGDRNMDGRIDEKDLSAFLNAIQGN